MDLLHIESCSPDRAEGSFTFLTPLPKCCNKKYSSQFLKRKFDSKLQYTIFVIHTGYMFLKSSFEAQCTLIVAWPTIMQNLKP